MVKKETMAIETSVPQRQNEADIVTVRGDDALRIQFALKAVSKDSKRGWLQNLHIAYSQHKEKFFVEGTDGKRLHRAYLEYGYDEGVYMVWSSTGKKVFDAIVLMRRVDDTSSFPDTDKVIPSHARFFGTVDLAKKNKIELGEEEGTIQAIIGNHAEEPTAVNPVYLKDLKGMCLEIGMDETEKIAVLWNEADAYLVVIATLRPQKIDKAGTIKYL